MKLWKKILIGVGVVLLLLCIAASQLLVFYVIPPIGAVPDGITVVMWKSNIYNRLLDSCDAHCLRMGRGNKEEGVQVFCRLASMNGIVQNQNIVIVKLPYMSAIYDYSLAHNAEIDAALINNTMN